MSAIQSTSSYEEARGWAKELYGEVNFLDFWFPKSEFISAMRRGNSMSAARKDSEHGIYAMSLGPLAPIDPNWDHFSISRTSDLTQINLDHYKMDGEWDAYQIQSKVHQELTPLENLVAKENHPQINQFLETHFPDTSVKAEEKEVKSWAALKNENGEIIAIGALAEWESGNLAAQGIAVHQDYRGQGLGKEFVKRLVASAHHLGYPSLCLGVWHFNESAKHVYETSGFHLIDRFIHFRKQNDPRQLKDDPVKE